MARERTKHSNASVELEGGSLLDFVWCKTLEEVLASVRHVLELVARCVSAWALGSPSRPAFASFASL